MDALTPDQRDRAMLGLCPYCERPIRGWHLPVEGLPPDLYRAMRDHWNIDPRTGHSEQCREKGVTLR